MRPRFLVVLSSAALAGVLALPAVATANHSWSDYHWGRTANPFTVKLGDNVSTAWDNMLRTASSDWSQTTSGNPVRTSVVAGSTTGKRCRPTLGRVEVCSADYGGVQWLGLAQIWLTTGDHIAQGIVKNNDHYFGNSTYKYNNTAEMQHVICQEIGHTLGLDHQSTDGTSLNTCMDYYHNTSASDTKSTHPNSHDYQELATIYSHLDGTNTILSAAPAGNGHAEAADASGWGRLVSSSDQGRAQTFVSDLGGGNRLVTFVIWAS